MHMIAPSKPIVKLFMNHYTRRLCVYQFNGNSSLRQADFADESATVGGAVCG
jgi:hypothetical protein